MSRRLIQLVRDAYSGLPGSIWLLSIAYFVNRCGTMVLAWLALFLKSHRGFSASESGALLGVYGVGAIAGALLGGWLTTRFGAIRTMVISLALSGPAFLSLRLFDDWWAICGTLLLTSIIAEAVRPAGVTATAEYCPKELHKKAYALNRLAVNLGMTFGPMIGGFLYYYNVELIFVAEALTCVAAALLVYCCFGLGRSRAEEKSSPEPEQHATSPWRDVSFLSFLFLLFALSLVFMQLTSSYPVFMVESLGYQTGQLGMLLAINTVVIVVVEMVLIHLMRNHSELIVIGIGSFLVCIGFGLTAQAGSLAICVMSILIWTIGEMLALPLALTYASRRANAANRGMYLGLFTTCFSAASVVAPLIGMWLYEQDARFPWYASYGMALPVMLGFFWLARRDAQTDQSAPRPHVACEVEVEQSRDIAGINRDDEPVSPREEGHAPRPHESRDRRELSTSAER